MNVNCGENVVYIYDGLPNFVSENKEWDRLKQDHMIGTFCSDHAKYPVTVEAKSGLMTIFFQKQNPSKGFNSTYRVITCPLLDENLGHICINGKPICKDGRRGTGCDIPVCPNKCSEDVGRGICQEEFGRCICNPGFVGEDCSILYKEHFVSYLNHFSYLFLIYYL